jgi:hypothetical protein
MTSNIAALSKRDMTHRRDIGDMTHPVMSSGLVLPHCQTQESTLQNTQNLFAPGICRMGDSLAEIYLKDLRKMVSI